jgi:transcriptional regulator with AAA-type ATPase domain
MVYISCIRGWGRQPLGGAVGVFEPAERQFAEAIRGLLHGNPFLPERIAYERQALGDAFRSAGADWNLHPELGAEHPNLEALCSRAAALLETLRARLKGAEPPSAEEGLLLEDLCFFHIYYRRREGFSLLIREAREGRLRPGPLALFQDFLGDVDRTLGMIPGRKPTTGEAAHLFACFFQIRRAFHHVFHFIVGRSAPAARLRAAVWESIFTHDLRRYWATLFDRMGDFTTLVVGPTGTGKELVARAIAHSRYIPFDPGTRTFSADFTTLFFPLSIEALPETLVESELFGHRRGAFTGAMEDRAGWLEGCPRAGTVFLDEIGELAPSIQVKLLRVLQERTFARVGETRGRPFSGKLLAATHRDPADLLRKGRMRGDFYYRICSDLVQVPSLRERLDDDPAELEELVRHLCRRNLGEEPGGLVEEVCGWIEPNLGPKYAWPGNIRELEQCVRNVLVRGSYRPPPELPEAADPFDETARAMRDGRLSADEALSRYCTWVYARSGSYLEAARRLGLDRRTVKARVDEGWLRGLR